MVLADILRTAFPVCADPAGWAEALAAPLARFDIGRHRLCHFLAQVGYESGQFNHTLENLMYSSPAAAAAAYLSQPRRRKYQNGAMALVTISASAKG